MTQEELKQRIDENNARLELLLNPACFILNEEVAAILKENNELRSQCKHEFIKGVCKYCNQEENV